MSTKESENSETSASESESESETSEPLKKMDQFSVRANNTYCRVFLNSE